MITSHLLQVRGTQIVNRFGLKNIKITGDAASANEEVATTFLAELSKLIKEERLLFKASLVISSW